jgi:hypothetical protein
MRKLAAFPRADERTNTLPFELLVSVKLQFSQGWCHGYLVIVGFVLLLFSDVCSIAQVNNSA